MPGMDAILEPLVASPALPRHLETLGRLLADERTRRERFYDEMTEQEKVEFINGEVFMHSPAKIRHVDAVGYLYRLLSQYVDRQGLGWVGSEKALICLTRNDYEPDIVFYGQEKAAQLQPDQMKLPAPDFIAEVLSPSTEAHDQGIKWQDYAAHGVREYWIVDPVAQTVEQNVLPETMAEGETATYGRGGVRSGDEELASVAVPGFRVPVRALFERSANLAALTTLGN